MRLIILTIFLNRFLFYSQVIILVLGGNKATIHSDICNYCQEKGGVS